MTKTGGLPEKYIKNLLEHRIIDLFLEKLCFKIIKRFTLFFDLSLLQTGICPRFSPISHSTVYQTKYVLKIGYDFPDFRGPKG